MNALRKGLLILILFLMPTFVWPQQSRPDENKGAPAAPTHHVLDHKPDIDAFTLVRFAQQGGWFDELIRLAAKHNLYNDTIQERAAQYIQSLGEQAKSLGIDEQTALAIQLTQALRQGSCAQRADLRKLLSSHGINSSL